MKELRKLSKYSIIVTILFFIYNHAFSQNKIEHKTKIYIDSINKVYSQTSQPIYLYISNTPNDNNPTPINNVTETKQAKPIFLKTNGKHQFKRYNTISKLEETFYIHADGTPPKTKIIFSNPEPYTTNNKIYYGNNQRIKLISKDDMSGINKILYSINNSEYKEYTTEIAVETEEKYLVKFYSIDNVGNVENIQENTFYIDKLAPKSICTISDTLGNEIISERGIITIETADIETGSSKIYYKLDSGEYKIFTKSSINLKKLSEGSHSIYFYATDNVNNKENEQETAFFLDKTSPIIATDILGDQFIIGDKIFFSGRTKLKLTAIDNKAGVKTVMFSIDKGAFKKYEEAFYLPATKGSHGVDYYAIDNLENRTRTKTKNGYLHYEHFIGKIYIDLTGPTLFHKFIGKQYLSKDTLYISKNTKIKFSQQDFESKPKKITYMIDNIPEEIDYSEPFSIKEEGFHQINQIGYDKVNNRNFKTLKFVVDAKGPEIFHRFSVKPSIISDTLETYPYYVSIFIAPQDDVSGIENISYTINDSPVKNYYRKISGFKKGEINTVIIHVNDKLGNSSTKKIQFFIKK